MKNRIQRVRDALSSQGSQAVFFTNAKNIYYLTGFIGLSPEERECSLLVTQTEAILFIPRMYEQEATEALAIHGGGIRLVVDHERDGLLTLFKNYVSAESRVLFEASDLRYAEVEHIQKQTGCTLIPSNGLAEGMRLIKDYDELQRIKKAVQLTDQVYSETIKMLSSTDYTELSELDVVDFMRKKQRDLGGSGFGFDPIVACGAHSAAPHHKTSNTKLTKGSLLLFDLGIVYQGYTGDLTRCAYLGKAPATVKYFYDVVLASNEAALRACRAGMTCSELFTVSNDVLAKAKLETYFLHGLGHGVGLDIHEKPYLRATSKDLLKDGMVVTIEPGVYFENEFGIRIEDFVVVRNGGCEVLSNASKELVEIV